MDAIQEGVAIGVTSSVINSAIKESKIIPNMIKVAKLAVTRTNPMMTLGFAGIAVDRQAKISVVVGMSGLVVGLVVSAPIIIKGALASSMACFSFGFVRGIRTAWKQA